MIKDSKLPMKLVFPFCILILPLTKSSLNCPSRIDLLLYFVPYLGHNCLNFFYLSWHLYVNCGCHSLFKSQMRIIKLVAQSYKHVKWCCALWCWVLLWWWIEKLGFSFIIWSLNVSVSSSSLGKHWRFSIFWFEHLFVVTVHKTYVLSHSNLSFVVHCP